MSTTPAPVEREALTEAMIDLLRMIVDLFPALIWMLSEIPPQRWPSEWTMTIANMADLLGLSNAASVLSQHALWLTRTLETDRGYWAGLAICGLCSVDKPPWEL